MKSISVSLFQRILKATHYRINIFYTFIKIRRKISHIQIILKHQFGLKEKENDNNKHLVNCINWLCRAQDESRSGGVSGGYSLEKSWLPPYPETTGYIIPTFIKYSEFTKDAQFLNRAIQMADWELKIQLDNGAVRGGMGISEYPIVFNTGQVILGWVSIYEKTNIQKYLSAAIKAADWLLSVQDEDGCWRKFTYMNIVHSYNSRVAWSLLKVYEHSYNEIYKNSALKNIKWALSRVEENGWIQNMSFFSDDQPFTHTIAYTLRGLHESSYYFDNELKEQIQNIVFNALVNITKSFRKNNKNSLFIPAKYNNQWQGAENHYSCLTGNAQLGILFHKYYPIFNDQRFSYIYQEILESLKTVQNLSIKNTGIQGGIPGSYPIWGKYMKYIYPNWAVKFFADLLLLELTSETK